ncbi:fibronectin type III domain-containing protein [Streptomyces milbemycinicus]|uniref:Fibronectin type III domain-containing protein n=1 Tax=Streptomyces milbemycinicus TaxID=476552 RepID=A0ABW8LGQ0_9ACTN
MSGARRALAAAVLTAAALAGCSSPQPATRSAGPAPSAATGTRLTATLTSPVDATLRWTGTEPGAAGRIVEFATAPEGPYTILEYVPLGQTSYRHPDLMPQTPFYYRVRPYYGPASRPVEVRLPKGDFTAKEQKSDHEWAPPRTLRQTAVRTGSVKDATTASAATPTGLKATVMHANGIRFTWTDHASDEQGYLLEDRPQGGDRFRPVAVLDPDINSFGLITLENEKRAAYRVRAFSYGKASNVVHLRTGASP